MDVIKSGTWKAPKTWLVRLICEQCEAVIEAKTTDELEADEFGVYIKCPECGQLHAITCLVPVEVLSTLLIAVPNV